MRVKRLLKNAQFARFCDNNGISPEDAAVLIDKANRAFNAGVAECNVPDMGIFADAARTRFEAVATRLGFVAYWPGLWPALKNMKGEEVYVPSI